MGIWRPRRHRLWSRFTRGMNPGREPRMSNRPPRPKGARRAPTLDQLAAAAGRLVNERYTHPRARRRHDAFDRHAAVLSELSEHFTSERAKLPRGYLDRPAVRAVYLLYYLATGAATARAVLRLAGLDKQNSGPPLRVLDLGAGPLTGSLGLALTLPSRSLDIVAVDTSTTIMADGVRIMRELWPQHKVETRRLDLRDRGVVRRLGSGFDLVLAGNVLNELPGGGQRGSEDPIARLVFGLLTNALAPGGRVVHWEPGTRMASSRLVALREAVLAEEVGRVMAPCAGVETCPFARSRADGWCHAEQPWKRPPAVADLDRAIGHRRGTLKFSWLVLSKVDEEVAQPGGWRIIGGPMRAGGVFRRYLCGSEGRVVATADARRLPADHALHTAWRGEWLAGLGSTKVERGRRGEKILRLIGGRSGDPRR